jgi:hypothetical protein
MLPITLDLKLSQIAFLSAMCRAKYPVHYRDQEAVNREVLVVIKYVFLLEWLPKENQRDHVPLMLLLPSGPYVGKGWVHRFALIILQVIRISRGKGLIPDATIRQDVETVNAAMIPLKVIEITIRHDMPHVGLTRYLLFTVERTRVSVIRRGGRFADLRKTRWKIRPLDEGNKRV